MKKRHFKRSGKGFWDKEYAQKDLLALSSEPSEDLEKFARWLQRESGKQFLNPTVSVLDLGCGNGRNLLYLASEYGVHGTGYDISHEAITQAKAASRNLRTDFHVRSIREPIPLPDASQTIVLDMMVSHVLKAPQRDALRREIVRVLKPGGWLFYKTFLLDEDEHAAQLLRDHPGDEPGSYIHPKIRAQEHVSTQEEIEQTLQESFFIHKMHPSHLHRLRGEAFKRRSICVYAERQ